MTHICRIIIIRITTDIIRDNSNKIKDKKIYTNCLKKSIKNFIFNVISFKLEDKIYAFSDKKAERMNDRNLHFKKH